jgi:HEAT repeat protein
MLSVVTDPSAEEGDEDVNHVAHGLARHPLRTLVEQHVLSLLDMDDESSRIGATQVLSHIETEEATNALMSRRSDPSARVRREALEGLLWYKRLHPECALEALSDPDPSVRSKAISLSQLFVSKWEVIPEAFLNVATRDQDERVRREAVLLAGSRLDAPSFGVLTAALTDPSATVRSAAAHCLAKMHPDFALEARLKALSEDDGDVREEAARTLGTARSRAAVPHLLRALPTTPAAREILWQISERMHTPGEADL